jgi:hypothetical protein
MTCRTGSHGQMPSLPIGAWDRSLPMQEAATSARLISLADLPISGKFPIGRPRSYFLDSR